MLLDIKLHFLAREHFVAGNIPEKEVAAGNQTEFLGDGTVCEKEISANRKTRYSRRLNGIPGREESIISSKEMGIRKEIVCKDQTALLGEVADGNGTKYFWG